MTIYDQLKKSDGGQGISDKTAPVAADKFVMADSEDNDELKLVPRDDMPGAQPRLTSNTAVKQTRVASSTQYLEFDTSEMENAVEFMFESIVPTIDGQRLEMQVKVGGVWQVTNYVYQVSYVPDNQTAPFDEGLNSTTEAHTTSSRLTGAIGNAATEGMSGRILLDNPSNAALYKNYSGELTYTGTDGTSIIFNVGGAYQGGGGAIEAVRFFMATGFVASGTIRMIDPTGGGSMTPLFSPVRMKCSTAQAFAHTSEEVIEYDEVVSDDDGLFDTTNFEFVAPRDCVIDAVVQVGFSNQSESSGQIETWIRVYKNSSTKVGDYNAGADSFGGDGRYSRCHIPYLALQAGDTLEARLWLYDTSGTGDRTIDNGDSHTFFTINEVPTRLSTLDPAVRAKWDSNYSYTRADITTKDGRTYKSITDNNVGNDPATDSTNWALIPEVATGDYSHVTMAADQTAIATNDVVEFDTPTAGNIPFDVSTHKWTLRAGKTYRGLAGFRLNEDAATDWARIQWQDGSGIITGSTQAICFPSTYSLADETSNPVATFVMTPTVDTDVWMIVGNQGNNPDIDSPYTYALIEQIGVGSYVPLAAPVRYETDAGQSIASGSPVIVDYEDKVYDDDNLVATGGSWAYTVASGGTLRVSAKAVFSTASWTASNVVRMRLYKNGALYTDLDFLSCDRTGSYPISLNGSSDVDVAAGDTIDVRLEQNSGGARSLSANADVNNVCITEIPTSVSVPTGDALSSPAVVNDFGGTASKTIASGGGTTLLSFANTVSDDDSQISAGTGSYTGATIFTAKHSGWHEVHCVLHLDSTAWLASDNFALDLYLNLAQAFTVFWDAPAANTYGPTVQLTYKIKLTAGDILHFRARAFLTATSYGGTSDNSFFISQMPNP